MKCLTVCILVLLYGVGDAQAGLKSKHGPTASQSVVVKAARSHAVGARAARPAVKRKGAGAHRSRHAPKRTAVQVWVASPFARCVRQAESGNGTNPAAANNLYGIQARNAGYAGGTSYSWARYVPRRVQDGIAYRLFLRYGDGPWRPYDGCVWTGV